MKLEITSGIHSKQSTKRPKYPLVENTHVKIDGKEISEMLDFVYFYVDTDNVAQWSIGFKGRPLRFRLKMKWRMFLLRLKKLMRRLRW